MITCLSLEAISSDSHRIKTAENEADLSTGISRRRGEAVLNDGEQISTERHHFIDELQVEPHALACKSSNNHDVSESKKERSNIHTPWQI